MNVIITRFKLIFLIEAVTQGLPLKSPSFVSPWFEITSNPSGQHRLDINHDLGEIPTYVQVQVKSISEPNKDFMFPAMGHINRDDDDSAPYSGIVYMYNDVEVIVSAPTEHSHYRGRTIYTENSNFWEGPNRQDTYTALVRVRAWKKASFPKPDYFSSGDPIGVGCDYSEEKICFYEKFHNFDEFPTFTVVRTKLKNTGDVTNFMLDAVGASHMVYQNMQYSQNGYVIYGFDRKGFRIWTDSSQSGEILVQDVHNFGTYSKDGELEIMAWNSMSMPQDFEKTIELGAIPGTYFEMETVYNLDSKAESDSIVGLVWVESRDGNNEGFRFPGTGSMAYSKSRVATPCCYGGLTYAYTNTTLRLWKPGHVDYGKLICIADMFADGKYSQASNNGTAIMKIWTVSNFGGRCNTRLDCEFEHANCVNNTCQCEAGYFEYISQCIKELTCKDSIPALPELARRQRNFIIGSEISSQNPVDDSYLRESWYRTINSNGQFLMPDSKTTPITGNCGTLNPAYIKGLHPFVGELTEDATDVDLTTLRQNATTYTIKVRKCADGVQYRLHPIISKSFAFCFDSPMIQGLTDFDEAPTGVSVGELNVRVDLEFYYRFNDDNKKRYLPSLAFYCESDEIKHLPSGLLFTTYWFINGDLLEAYGPSNNITRMTEQTLIDRKVSLGIEIQCGLQLSTSETGYKTEMVKSSAFFAGIKIHETSVVIRKGAMATIRFEPTVPIGCVYTNPNISDCSKSVYMKPVDKVKCEYSDLLSVQSRPKCGSQLKAFKEHTPWELSMYEFNITTEDVNYNDKYFFRLQLITDNYGHSIWNAYQLQDITVHVTHNDETKYKLCYSRVDPHMRTADKYPYEHQYQGEFILYRNFKYDIEVQMKTVICNLGRAYCACAVAIRAGGDVFLINLCGRTKYIGFTSCTDNGILVVNKMNERRYQVYTPIGTYIDMTIRPIPNYYNLMNVNIYMAPKDYLATEGLCGYYDNNKTNDLRKRNSIDYYPIKQSAGYHYHREFSNDWRIQSYERNYLKLNIKDVPRWGNSLFCACNRTGEQVPISVCSASLHIKCPLTEGTDDLQCLTYENLNGKEIHRRSLLSGASGTSIAKREDVERYKRDITEGEAESICRRVILGHPTVSEFKHRLIGIDLEETIKECTFDVSEEDDKSWADVYPDFLIEIIETYNKKDPKYVDEHKADILKFKLMSCQRNCSGNGLCNETGECDCKHGFVGSDCSINRSTPLTIDDIYGDGLCDISDHNTCDCFTIQTIELFRNFFCNVSMKKVLTNGSEENEQFTVPGTYKDIFNGACCIDDKMGRDKRSAAGIEVFTIQYDIAIGNDGYNFGDFKTVIVYDSNCQDVYSTGMRTVVLKTGRCFIDGRCVRENETTLQDGCLACSPDSSKYSWTNKCKLNDTHWYNLPLIAICTGTAAALIVLIGICVYLRCVCRPRKTVADVTGLDVMVLKTVQSNNTKTSRLVLGIHEE